FFPTAAVHGLLASIGLIIIAKQIHVVLGVKVAKPPIPSFLEIPNSIRNLNPEVAAIGLVSLALMFLIPLIKTWIKPLKYIPAQLIVLVIAIPMAYAFDFRDDHKYLVGGMEYNLGPSFLVNVPVSIEALKNSLAFPDFSALSAKP